VLVIDDKNNNDDEILVAMMENRKEAMIASRIVVYKLRRNSSKLHAKRKCVPGLRLKSFPKLRRDNIFTIVDETQIHQDSHKDQRSRHLTLRNSSNLGGRVISGERVTVVVGLNTVKNLDCYIRVHIGGMSVQERNRSHSLDPNMKDRQPLDPVDLQGG
jgi:hypothetical protein